MILRHAQQGAYTTYAMNSEGWVLIDALKAGLHVPTSVLMEAIGERRRPDQMRFEAAYDRHGTMTHVRAVRRK